MFKSKQNISGFDKQAQKKIQAMISEISTFHVKCSSDIQAHTIHHIRFLLIWITLDTEHR